MSGFQLQKGVLQSTHTFTWNVSDAVGRGATAVVYLGRHKVAGQVVAVKVFHQHLRYSQCNEDLPELEILRRLKHENIITVLGIEQELQTQRTVLVMEYCEGGSVLSMLDQPQYRYGLSEVHFLLVLYHVAAGMQYLRQAGVVHRDIKPANIMRSITEDGSSVYKLTDFGAARELSDGENFTSMYGTEEYLHPKMYEKGVLRLPSEQRFDARMDLWSLGVTFYHVATGQLPFQPYGGRSNKETMYHIISQKESGVISGRQQFEEGPIQWSRHLPSTCLLSSGVRGFVTPLLADLMEGGRGHGLSYGAFFSRVQRLKAQVCLRLFDYLHAAEHTLLLDPSARLSTLQSSVASVTEMPVSQQLLLVGGHALEEVVDPQAPISSFPTHITQSLIYLFPREPTALQPLQLSPPEIPAFPVFLDVVDIAGDNSLALNCQARGHLIQQHTQHIGHRQACLLHGHLHLRMYVEARVRTVAVTLQMIRQLVAETRKRFATFYSSVKSIQGLLITSGHGPDPYLRDILNDDTLLQVQRKTEERVEEIRQYRQGVADKVTETQRHGAQWSEQCQHTSCLSKVEHQLTVISQIQSRFRRDKSVKEKMNPHDSNIHRFERQKLQETCTRMLSILTGHCVPALDRLHTQAFHFTGTLTKSLARLVKVEKNDESVINCQQLLSARLDRLETKCQEEVDHLQRQFSQLARGQQQQQRPPPAPLTKLSHPHISSVDEGLGTSVLGSGSGSGSGSVGSKSTTIPTHPSSCQESTVNTGSIAVSVDSVSVRDSLQSLREESEEVLHLVKQNLDIMTRLEEESMLMGGSGLFPTVM
ncbi:inhibitor of nuclear factor kappa-B kinase subunit epsilon-like [Babylonia areolata]|uniref:inhibitor of nuclear factor kappa-B kinase subunit epsilon-like n=1 Tax=Babylonia areolata TaxID=304850 RepID=UPI003FD48BFF